jgi:hypothetical protein
MSQYPQPVFQPPMKFPQAAPPQENGWGLAGFVVSIAGLLLCGIPSIVGILLSVIGLRKEPRGLAVAGLLIGLVGVMEILACGLFLLMVYRVAETGVGVARDHMITSQLELEASIIGDEWQKNGQLPTQAEGEDLLAGKRDVIGNSIVYETDGVSFSLRSAGPDGILETDDDTVVGPYNDAKSTGHFTFGEDLDFDFDKFKGELESMDDLDQMDNKLKSMEDALNKALKEGEDD